MIKTINDLAALGVSVRELPHLTSYTGSMEALIGAGLATAEQFPTGMMKSGGYKGSSRNPGQRWKVCRRSGGLFEVRRWHERRERALPNLNESGFQRFIRVAAGEEYPRLRLVFSKP